MRTALPKQRADARDVQTVERIADALGLAPRSTWGPGEVRRSFGFAGHSNIFRELNLLRARGKPGSTADPRLHVLPTQEFEMADDDVPSKSPAPEELLTVPPSLQLPESWYFTTAAEECLNPWMSQAKSALDVRWASVRETFTKAQFENTKQAWCNELYTKQLQEMLIRAGNVLDKHKIRTALGKHQPKQRMWALFGPGLPGIKLVFGGNEQASLLEFLGTLPESRETVRISGSQHGLQFWFCRLLLLGDFLVRWCGSHHAWSGLILQSPCTTTTVCSHCAR